MVDTHFQNLNLAMPLPRMRENFQSSAMSVIYFLHGPPPFSIFYGKNRKRLALHSAVDKKADRPIWQVNTGILLQISGYYSKFYVFGKRPCQFLSTPS